jgi:hypothetical protein
MSAAENICGAQKTKVVCRVGSGFAEKKAALVIRFSSHSAVASYQSSGLSSVGRPTGIVVTWSWISCDSPQRNLMTMASPLVYPASLMRSQNLSVYLSTVWCPWWYSAVSSRVSALWASLFGQNVFTKPSQDANHNKYHETPFLASYQSTRSAYRLALPAFMYDNAQCTLDVLLVNCCRARFMYSSQEFRKAWPL